MAGIPKQDRYEAAIVGGFSVLKEGSDPLRVMQAMAGAATALALLIASGVLLFEDALRLPLLIPTILVTFVTLGLAVLDVVADDTKLLGASNRRCHAVGPSRGSGVVVVPRIPRRLRGLRRPRSRSVSCGKSSSSSWRASTDSDWVASRWSTVSTSSISSSG